MMVGIDFDLFSHHVLIFSLFLGVHCTMSFPFYLKSKRIRMNLFKFILVSSRNASGGKKGETVKYEQQQKQQQRRSRAAFPDAQIDPGGGENLV